MTPDEMNELKELIELLKKNKVGEFDLDRTDMKVRIKFADAVAAAPVTVNTVPQVQHGTAEHGVASQPQAAAPVAEPEEKLHIIKSPIVGTFYESPSPGAGAFVRVGDQVDNGQVVCIVEAMKLMNEIEADAAGEIVKRFVTNGQPVEYGQQLFAVRPR